MENNTKFTTPHRYFDTIDYTITVAMLALSTFIGIYFGFFSKKKPDTTIEYLIGDRKIGLFPIAMSLAAGYIGSAQFLAMGTDFYKYGAQFLLSCVATMLSCCCLAVIFIPVLYELNVISSYEYFKIRFNNVVRVFGSFLFVLKMIVVVSIGTYGPCLTVAQVSGIDVKVLIPCVSAVVIFYTSIGGLRAVVWTDTYQMIFMVTGALSIMIIGCYKAGGIERVWQENENAGRMSLFQMSSDPSVRYTFWDITVGYTVTKTCFLLVNQSITQRCLSLSSFKKARIAIFIYCFLSVMFIVVIAITSFAAYTLFRYCDPITSKTISKGDQIMPYFMMNVTENIPAIPGIYLSAIFSASLSSVSTALNSLAGVILIDFIRPIWRTSISDAQEALIMKIIVFITGLILIALVYLVDQIGDLFQTILSLGAITTGALMGIFTLGMLFPWANSKGALAGGLSALAVIIWISTGAQINKKKIVMNYKTSLSVDGCDNSTLNTYYSYINSTDSAAPVAATDQGDIFPLYKISFLYYDLIGIVTVLVVGLLVSFLTGPNHPKEMNPKLFPNLIGRFCKREEKLAENLELMKTNEE